MVDRQLGFLAHDLRRELGKWMDRRMGKGTRRDGKGASDQEIRAMATLRECGVPLPELRAQWELQRAAQMSLRARKSHHLLVERFQLNCD